MQKTRVPKKPVIDPEQLEKEKAELEQGKAQLAEQVEALEKLQQETEKVKAEADKVIDKVDTLAEENTNLKGKMKSATTLLKMFKKEKEERQKADKTDQDGFARYRENIGEAINLIVLAHNRVINLDDTGREASRYIRPRIKYLREITEPVVIKESQNEGIMVIRECLHKMVILAGDYQDAEGRLKPINKVPEFDATAIADYLVRQTDMVETLMGIDDGRGKKTEEEGEENDKG